MSLENLERFYQRVLEDPALQERLQEAPDKDRLVDLAVHLGQENGYDFTSEELRQRIEEVWGRQEISYPLENILDLPRTY
jgi:predicted ribosomally synthesized peptide with nif11-like leader